MHWYYNGSRRRIKKLQSLYGLMRQWRMMYTYTVHRPLDQELKDKQRKVCKTSLNPAEAA